MKDGILAEAWQKLLRRIHMVQPSQLPSLAALLVSVAAAAVGFTALARTIQLDRMIAAGFFLVMGVLFVVEEVRIFLINKRKSARLLLFAITMLVLAYLATMLPEVIDLRHLGFTAGLTRFIVVSIGLILFGIIGGALALGAYYNFRPIGTQQGAYLVLLFCLFLVLYPLAIIIGEVIVNGAPGLSWEFMTQDIRDLGTKGGALSGIVGTLLLIALIFLIAVPLGICAAIYLQEYAGKHFITRIINTAVTILRGVPSIVFGLFAFAFFEPVFGASFLTGGLILSVYALPMIIRASVEALKGIPDTLREGSLALGASKWQTIRRVVLPPSLPGIITGVVLGVGEAAGETAPIMFFATLRLSRMPPNPLGDSITSLQTHLYTLFGMRGLGGAADKAARMQNAWSIALVLLIIILTMNIVALFIREKYRQEF
ncbi:MAG: phosphate ABC transporter permease PstA [Thermoplasmatota archaeon]